MQVPSDGGHTQAIGERPLAGEIGRGDVVTRIERVIMPVRPQIEIKEVEPGTHQVFWREAIFAWAADLIVTGTIVVATQVARYSSSGLRLVLRLSSSAERLHSGRQLALEFLAYKAIGLDDGLADLTTIKLPQRTQLLVCVVGQIQFNHKVMLYIAYTGLNPLPEVGMEPAGWGWSLQACGNQRLCDLLPV